MFRVWALLAGRAARRTQRQLRGGLCFQGCFGQPGAREDLPEGQEAAAGLTEKKAKKLLGRPGRFSIFVFWVLLALWARAAFRGEPFEMQGIWPAR